MKLSAEAAMVSGSSGRVVSEPHFKILKSGAATGMPMEMAVMGGDD